MNGCKYYKQEEQVSYDNEQTWESTGNYRKGELYESYSPDCSVHQRWTLVPGGYICENDSKYQKLISEVSDDGINYKIKYPVEYSKGALIEADSAVCNYKWYGHYKLGSAPPAHVIDPIKIVLCSGSSEVLTSTDIEYQTNYAVISGYVGGCVSSITNKIFSGQTALEYLDISDTNISEIKESDFRDCQALKGINLPNSLTSIGKHAFDCCYSLASVTIPNNVTTIDEYAFHDCSGLTSVTIPNNVTSIDNYAFFDCYGLTGVTIPNSVTSIGIQAFYHCSGLTSVTFGNNLEDIGIASFQGCSGLTSVTIPDSVTSISSRAFRHCKGLTSVTIGSGVTSISDSFDYCGGPISVTIYATTPPTLSNSAFYNTSVNAIYAPANSVNAYKTASGWSGYASKIFPIT